ncbi:hypothetical protein TNCV_4399011 [Trichonephila clavipes]|nr:hypothetical protein TNCV_4399011 [Trichonephila clavipes]
MTPELVPSLQTTTPHHGRTLSFNRFSIHHLFYTECLQWYPNLNSQPIGHEFLNLTTWLLRTSHNFEPRSSDEGVTLVRIPVSKLLHLVNFNFRGLNR